MAKWLRQSTAIVLSIGPFLDSSDGVTPEIALSIAQADIQIKKNGAAFAQTSDTTPSATHDVDGYYNLPLTLTDTNTLGPMRVQISMAGALPVWDDFIVLPAVVYDALVNNSDALQVDVVQISGDATAADNLESYCDGTTPQPVNSIQIEGLDATDQITSSVSGALTSYDVVSNSALTAALGALNDLDSTAVQAASSAAIIAYDPPTNAEMNANFSAISTQLVDIDSDTGTAIPSLINNLENASLADIKAQLVAALTTDIQNELSSIPAASTSISNMINLLYLLARNRTTHNRNTGVVALRNDAESADIGSCTASDDGTTFTRGKIS